MATFKTVMPYVTSSAETVTDQLVKLRLIQWVDDAEDIVDSDDLVITVNGQTLTAKIQVATTTGGEAVEAVSPNIGNVVVWQIGPFNPGIWVRGLTTVTIDHGAVHFWWD